MRTAHSKSRPSATGRGCGKLLDTRASILGPKDAYGTRTVPDRQVDPEAASISQRRQHQPAIVVARPPRAMAHQASEQRSTLGSPRDVPASELRFAGTRPGAALPPASLAGHRRLWGNADESRDRSIRIGADVGGRPCAGPGVIDSFRSRASEEENPSSCRASSVSSFKPANARKAESPNKVRRRWDPVRSL